MACLQHLAGRQVLNAPVGVGLGLTTGLAGACLQDFASHQVLNDLAQQLDNLAITQRRQRHTRPRQQKVARQDCDLSVVVPRTCTKRKERVLKPCHSFIQTRVFIQGQPDNPPTVSRHVVVEVPISALLSRAKQR